jgi:DNA-binding CsgD family transcriptional regulator
VALAVDQLEAGDRAEYDESVATIRWAAATDRNPRLRWWAATVSAGAALLDGDLDTAARHRSEAQVLGAEYNLPGWVAAEVMLAAETSLERRDADDLRGYLIPSDSPILASPIARSSLAFMAALLEEPELSSQHGRIALRAVDEESSYLLCLSLLARAAVTSGDVELGADCERLLAPWAGHVAVDAGGWWCSGPVDLRLAELALLAGDDARAEQHLAVAEPAIRAAGDVRSAAAVEGVRRRLGSAVPASQRRTPSSLQVERLSELSDRERDVLVLIAQGHTNADIGTRLSYSASTIRADTVSIYRKIGVKGRAEAAALAVSAGLADRHTP